MKKRYKAVIYDIDGTLLNTFDMNMYPLIQIIQEELGETWTLDQVRPFYAQPGLKTMKDLGIQDIDKTYARWVAYVNTYKTGATPFGGIVGMLERFQVDGIRQAVVSSKMRGQYEIDVVNQGLASYMETAVLEEDTEKHKPDPEPILECLRRMKLDPRDVIYIGDAESDLIAAQRAGVDFGLACWGNCTFSGAEKANFQFQRPEDMLILF